MQIDCQSARENGHTASNATFAARDPETPLLVRTLALIVAAYALSPIDLIPDFIPIVGYLDDLIIVPIGLLLVIRLLPPHVLESSRAKAASVIERPRSRIAAFVIVLIWLLSLLLVAALVKYLFTRG